MLTAFGTFKKGELNYLYKSTVSIIFDLEKITTNHMSNHTMVKHMSETIPNN